MAGDTPIPLDKAYLSAIWLETMFYGMSSRARAPAIQVRMLIIRSTGMNFVLFWTCMATLTIRRRTPRVNKFLVAVAFTMFAFSTAHVSLGFQRLIEGFITRRNETGGPGAFFSDVSIPANVVKVGIHTVNVSTRMFRLAPPLFSDAPRRA